MSTPQGSWNFGWPVAVAVVAVVGGVLALAAMNKLPTEMFGVRWSSTPSTNPSATPNSIQNTEASVTPSPTQSVLTVSPEAEQSLWKFMGQASTGESVYIDTVNITRTAESISFNYKIGNEIVEARTDCSNNRWYADKYGWSSPSSQATREMLSYVCK